MQRFKLFCGVNLFELGGEGTVKTAPFCLNESCGCEDELSGLKCWVAVCYDRL